MQGNPPISLEFDPEIERTARARLRAARAAMGDNPNGQGQGAAVNPAGNPAHVGENEGEAPRRRTMRDYTTPTLGSVYPGFGPAIANQQFEIKPAILNVIRNNVQFAGLAHEDALMHLADFAEICGTFRYGGITDDTVKLRLFPFSLRDRAKSWLYSLPPGTATTWDVLAAKFLEKYNPVDKILTQRREIGNFRQMDQESLAEAWERYNELLRKCPGHEMEDWNVVQTFYFGIDSGYRANIDAAAGGTIRNLTPEEALQLLNETASHSTYWTAGRETTRSTRGIFAIGSATSAAAPVTVIACQSCGGSGHHAYECPGNEVHSDLGKLSMEENVSYMGNSNRNPPFGNAYNPGVRNHPNFSWNQNAPGQRWQPGQHQYDAPASSSQPRPPHPGYMQDLQGGRKSKLEEMMEKFVEASRTNMASQSASIRNLEIKIGQLAQAVSERAQGTLPGNTEKNPADRTNSLSEIPVQSNVDFQIEIEVNEVATPALCDSGSSCNVLSLKDVARFDLEMNTNERTSLTLANGETVESEGTVKEVSVVVDGNEFMAGFQVLGPLENSSVPILGVPFLAASGITLDCSRKRALLPSQVEACSIEGYKQKFILSDDVASFVASDTGDKNQDAAEIKEKAKKVTWSHPLESSETKEEASAEHARWSSPTVERKKKERKLLAARVCSLRGKEVKGKWKEATPLLKRTGVAFDPSLLPGGNQHKAAFS